MDTLVSDDSEPPTPGQPQRTETARSAESGRLPPADVADTSVSSSTPDQNADVGVVEDLRQAVPAHDLIDKSFAVVSAAVVAKAEQSSMGTAPFLPTETIPALELKSDSRYRQRSSTCIVC